MKEEIFFSPTPWGRNQLLVLQHTGVCKMNFTWILFCVRWQGDCDDSEWDKVAGLPNQVDNPLVTSLPDVLTIDLELKMSFVHYLTYLISLALLHSFTISIIHYIVFVWSQCDGANIEQRTIGCGWHQNQEAKLKIVGEDLYWCNVITYSAF